MDVQKLKDAGIDVDGALERFMGNQALMEKFLKKFPADTNFAKLEEAIRQGNKEDALAASHTLKGVCGNLSMQTMFELMTEQVRLFRADEWQQAVDMMPEVRAAYERILDVIGEG